MSSAPVKSTCAPVHSEVLSSPRTSRSITRMFDHPITYKLCRMQGKRYSERTPDRNSESSSDFAPLDLCRYHVLTTVDPDTNGSGWLLIHDFGIKNKDGHFVRSMLRHFPLKRAASGAIDGLDMYYSLMAAVRLRPDEMRIGESAVVDAFVEDAHAHGSYRCGVSVGIAMGVMESWTCRWPHCDHDSERRARDACVSLISATTWTTGLFNCKQGRAPDKQARIAYCMKHAPQEVRSAIEDATNANKKKHAESLADSWCMALYAMHRAYDEACVQAFPRRPTRPLLSTAIEDERTSPWRTPLSTLTVPELKSLLRAHRCSVTGDKAQLRARAAEMLEEAA